MSIESVSAGDGRAGPDFKGRRILVVEDDQTQAKQLSSTLKARGASVLGPAPTCFYAQNLMMGPRTIDGAILDTRRGRDELLTLASELRRRGVPFVFGGQPGEVQPAALQGAPCLERPSCDGWLEQLAQEMVSIHAHPDLKPAVPGSEVAPEPKPEPINAPLCRSDRLAHSVVLAMKQRP
ncbi:hypothetical protein GCM10007989_11900 [Devosia pacifica]|uniref:Response regulatory domain-containing protein n=2 Tax=Devosia pacifica TaxID=1335967 RepID=A0A918S064_9HYPH|nr:hypothetical protein GCM10007989_11900 [Devosia pacifica]